MAGVTIALRTEITITDTDAPATETAPTHVIQKTITGAETLSPKRVQLQNEEKTLWSAAGAGEPATAFQLMVIETDVVVDVELTCAEGDSDENRFSVRIQPGFPLILGDDTSTERESGGDAFDGTSGDITLVRVKERNNVLATVRALFVKP
jgi:hypothetical protein